ncbi:MAG TPA: glycosyltransferase family 39 protein, partial [Candidatus Ratteibacteria bacterium]|nr:glycosyltransferase family 39 protein [Candidatus Ratteibacteria bacterium]
MNNNRIRLFFLIIIICIGIFLRIFQLGKLCFWCDEFLAISYGWQPLKDMVNYIAYKDAHPPLFYALVHFLLKYGNSEFYLRLLPSFFGIITIPLAYFIGKEFTKNEKTGIIFSIIISLNPALILWSRILKSYSLFTFFLLLSLFFFLKILKSDRKKYYIFLFFSDIILLYLHNFAFIWILIEVFTLLFRKMFNKKFLFYYFSLFIFYLPWFLKIPYQLKFTLGVIRPI